ncbi:MAG: hypothetical protein AAFP13_03050 [Pseudomonadota bacterium]
MNTTTQLLAGALALALGITGLAAEAEAQGRDRLAPDFSELDGNGDGEVSLAEMRAWGDARFAAADSDGDGALTAEEIFAVREAQSAVRIEARIARLIDRADANGNGTLERGEFGPGAARVEARFDQLDADGSGGLSPEELAKARDARG